MQHDYVVKISRLIKVIVAQENAIFLGRGINYILEDKREGLRVRLTAPLTQRIKNISQLRNISEKEAEELIIKRTRNGGISSNKTSKEILILAKVMI